MLPARMIRAVTPVRPIISAEYIDAASAMIVTAGSRRRPMTLPGEPDITGDRGMATAGSRSRDSVKVLYNARATAIVWLSTFIQAPGSGETIEPPEVSW